MIRRQFLKLASLASATGLASLGAVETVPSERPLASRQALRSVQWNVQGFTCVTCAVGLETMIGRQPGVASVQATYPQGRVSIQYDPAQVNEATLRSAIEELGFRV